MCRFIHLPLVFLVLLVCTAEARAERVLDHFDVDSLAALAQLIVKVEIGDSTDVRTPDGDCAVWSVKVVSCLHGSVKQNTVFKVAGIEEYRKGPGFDGVEKGFHRLAKGDIAYLFLVPKNAPRGYSKYRLTDAEWKVIESGARLVAKDRVHSFGQYWPPQSSTSAGFIARTRRTFPKTAVLSTDSFEKRLRQSLEFVAELQRNLAEESLGEKDRQAILESRSKVLKRESASSDYIAQLLGE